MAEKFSRRDQSSHFKSVQIHKDHKLGVGAFGIVYKAQCDDLVCAAKFIHEILWQLGSPGKDFSVRSSFERECELLASCRHPNIVQYLGMTADPDTHQPGLLMERMDTDLCHYLESCLQSLSYHLEVNICHDVALALSYLHAKNIVHRDVSSRNIVLKVDSITAKLIDFGVATSDMTDLVNSPGNPIYMPPEAVMYPPNYCEKIDCFSFGVVMVEIMSREFPNPADLLDRKIHVPEMERRKNIIHKIDPNHPLLLIALDCLKNKDVERPSAHQLCERIAALKETLQYTESARARPESVREVQEQIQCEIEQHALEQEYNREEIHRLRNEIKKKEELFQDVVENSSRAIESEVQKRTSQLQQQLSASQYEKGQLQQELARSNTEHQAQFQQQQLELTHARRQISDLQQMIRDEQSRASRTLDEVNTRMREKENRIRQLERSLESANAEVLGSRFTQLQLLPQGNSWNVPRSEVIITEQIGYGAAGLVSKGRYQGQVVAVKQIHREILREKHIMDEFKREVGIMATIQHPNLVRFIAAVFDERVEQLRDTPLLVLELLHTNLRDAYKDYNLGASKSLPIFRDVAYALHYLHEHSESIIHRDVSAPNVLLEALPGDTWRAKLSDFGSANFLHRAKTLGVGAIVYTAPEMFPRDDPSAPMPRPTTKCDVFSYGIVLVEVITMTMPTTENRHELFRQVQGKWQLMYDLISQCVQSNPSDRPTMADVLNQLNRIPSARARVN